MARPREAVGCRTLIYRKADSGQLNDLVTIHLVVDKRCGVLQESFAARSRSCVVSERSASPSCLRQPSQTAE